MGNLLRWSNQGDRPDDIWVCMLSDLFKNMALSDQTQVFDFQSMKRSLGRGLEELMKTSRGTSKAEVSSQEMSDSRLGDGPPEDRCASQGGISRLMRGRASQLDDASSEGSARFGLETLASSAESVGSSEPAGFAPSWVFYLADAMVMIVVIGHCMQSLTEGRDPSWVLSLGATLIAAGLGVYPWLRNLQYLEKASTLVRLPRWNLIRESNLDGENKNFVLHLQYPPAAVEMLQTSWGEIQPRPVWFAGVPDLTPDQLQTFLREAQSFFHEQCEDSSSKASSCISAA